MQTHRERRPAIAIIVGTARDISFLSSLTVGLNLYFRLVKKKKKLANHENRTSSAGSLILEWFSRFKAAF